MRLKNIIALAAIFFLSLSFAQIYGQNNEFELAIKNQFKKAPLFISKSPIKLAKYLTKNDSTNHQKALNIYTWIVHNIKYDVKALNKIKSKKHTVKQTLKRRKGICYQYSNLFNRLCLNAGISSKEILGYSRGNSYFEGDIFFETDHAWNGVKLDSAWFLVDPTWGSGHLIPKKQWFKKLMYKWFKKPYIKNKFRFVRSPNYKYFKVQPEYLIKNHLPADPSWQLLKYPISVKTFESNSWDTYQNNIDSIYSEVIDSADYSIKLNRYEFLASNQYLDITATRANSFNPKNYKLLSASSFVNAPLKPNYSNDKESIIRNNKVSVQNYKSTISLAKRHLRIIGSESTKGLQNTLNRIRKEISQPSEKRIKSTKYQLSKSEKILRTKEKYLEKHETQISNLQNAVENKKLKVLDLKRFPSEPKPDLVEKNMDKLVEGFDRTTQLEDSISQFFKFLKGSIKKKRSIQSLIVILNKKLSLYTSNNSALINSNQRFSRLGYSITEIASIGIQIDSLNVLLKKNNDSITRTNRKLRAFNSSIISQASLNQKMLFDNCRFSKGSNCDSLAYSKSSYSMYRSTRRKLDIQKLIYEMKKKDYEYHESTLSILQKQSEFQKTNMDFISLYKEWRKSGIMFNKQKSTYEIHEIISKSEREIDSLNLTNRKLKNLMLANKRKG